MISEQDERIVREIKDELISLYKNLSDCTKNRDMESTTMYEKKIKELETLLNERSVRVYDCHCESDEDSDEAYQKYLDGKSIQCISCMRDFVEKEKAKYPLLLDDLNWGLTGLFQEPPSEESSGVTSSDEEEPKTASYAKLKMLRRLRRQGPDKFELKYFSSQVNEFLRLELEESELEAILAIELNKELSNKFEGCKRKLMSPVENFDNYATGNFTISSDIGLKANYSSTDFLYISQIISNVKRYLEEHSKDYYPDVSEVMSTIDKIFCEDQDALIHYYHVLRKSYLGISRRPNSVESKKLNDLQEKNLQHGRTRKDMGSNRAHTLREEINRGRKTGKLNLSCRALSEVPKSIWSINKESEDCYSSGMNKISPMTQRSKKTFNEPLKHLDLSTNQLTTFTPVGACFDTLITMNLANNIISKLPSTLKNFSSLTDLNLEKNNITKLPKAIGRIATLRRLNASKNDLTTIPDEFGNLNDLMALDVRWNKLRTLPETLSDLCNLKVLNAGYNRLRQIPKNTRKMAGLVVLDVSYNKIALLPILIGLTHLIVLNASGNYIKLFPNLSGCKHLCEIRLDGNRIKKLNIELVKNVPVVQLTLSYNKILKIPDNYYNLETLVLLDLTGNRLKWLPWSLGRCKYLSCLKVEMNSIKNVRRDDIKEGSKSILEVLLKNLLIYEGSSEAIVQARRETEVSLCSKYSDDVSSETKKDEDDTTSVAASYRNVNLLGKPAVQTRWLEQFAKRKVSSFDLSKNKLGWFPYNLTMLAPSLELLFVRNNCFKCIPRFISEFKNLTVLDISENHLTNFPATIVQCPLVKLLCKYNQFLQIPEVVYEILTIEHIDFSYNEIKIIDVEGLLNLKNLSALNLRSNEIRSVPSALGFLTNIKELNIDDNYFTYPDRRVLDQGTEEIMKCLRRYGDSNLQCKHSKDLKKNQLINDVINSEFDGKNI